MPNNIIQFSWFVQLYILKFLHKFHVIFAPVCKPVVGIVSVSSCADKFYVYFFVVDVVSDEFEWSEQEEGCD